MKVRKKNTPTTNDTAAGIVVGSPFPKMYYEKCNGNNQSLLFQDSKLKFCNAFAFISGCQPRGGLQVTFWKTHNAPYIPTSRRSIRVSGSTPILQIRTLRLSQEVGSGWVGAESPYTDCLLNLFSITHKLHFIGNSWQKRSAFRSARYGFDLGSQLWPSQFLIVNSYLYSSESLFPSV